MRRSIIILLTFIIISIFLICPVYSAKLNFEWTPNSEPDLAGYRIFYREEGSTYNYNQPAWEGTEVTASIIIPDDGKVYHFVARAFDTEGFESADSIELTYQSVSTGLGTLEGGITLADINSTKYEGIVFIGNSGRSISFDWPDISNAEIYQVRLNLIQTNTISAIGNTPNSQISIAIPKTGLFAFQVRGGRHVGQADEEWTPWYSSDQPGTMLVDGVTKKVLFSGWPAAVGPIVIE